MRTIPEEIKYDVNKISDALVNYDNKKKLSWLHAYRDVLKMLNMEDKIGDDKILSNVVSKLTILGYDIVPEPFSLEKYR